MEVLQTIVNIILIITIITVVWALFLVLIRMKQGRSLIMPTVIMFICLVIMIGGTIFLNLTPQKDKPCPNGCSQSENHCTHSETRYVPFMSPFTFGG